MIAASADPGVIEDWWTAGWPRWEVPTASTRGPETTRPVLRSSRPPAPRSGPPASGCGPDVLPATGRSPSREMTGRTHDRHWGHPRVPSTSSTISCARHRLRPGPRLRGAAWRSPWTAVRTRSASCGGRARLRRGVRTGQSRREALAVAAARSTEAGEAGLPKPHAPVERRSASDQRGAERRRLGLHRVVPVRVHPPGRLLVVVHAGFLWPRHADCGAEASGHAAPAICRHRRPIPVGRGPGAAPGCAGDRTDLWQGPESVVFGHAVQSLTESPRQLTRSRSPLPGHRHRVLLRRAIELCGLSVRGDRAGVRA